MSPRTNRPEWTALRRAIAGRATALRLVAACVARTEASYPVSMLEALKFHTFVSREHRKKSTSSLVLSTQGSIMLSRTDLHDTPTLR